MQDQIKLGKGDFLERFAQHDHQHDMDETGLNLAQPEIARLITRALLEENGVFYEILYSCIMPTHVHLVLDTSIDIDPSNLSSILKKIKSRSSLEINKYLNRRGTFWQKPSYYHLIRDDNDLERIGNYIIENPVKAGKTKNWEDWPYTYVKYS